MTLLALRLLRFSRQFEAFHVFKVFVANPRKPPEIVAALVRNQARLVGYLETFHADRNDPQFLDETLSSAILSTSPDPTRLSLDLEPFAVARIVISPHSAATDAFLID